MNMAWMPCLSQLLSIPHAGLTCADYKKLADFERQLENNLARDAAHSLAYLATSRVNLELTKERWPDIVFHETREHAVTL